MAKENFPKALGYELKFEGGKDDDPRDPGGRTNQGIIQRVYDAYRKRNGKSPADVFNMTNIERDDIYRRQYFDAVRFDELPPGLDIVIVDGAINSGPAQSIKWVQRALGLSATGVLGEVTLQRLIDDQDNDLLIAKILDRRRAFYRGLKTFKVFGRGWLSRVDQLQKIGQAWGRGSVGPDVVWIGNMNKKADLRDAKPLPAMTPPAALSGTGAGGTALSTIQQTLTPMSDNEYVGKVLFYITIGLAVLTAIGVAWAFYARTRRDELQDILDLRPQEPGPADNDNTPDEVLQQYADPTARGTDTGNIAPGHITQSGRVAGDTETRVNSQAA